MNLTNKDGYQSIAGFKITIQSKSTETLNQDLIRSENDKGWYRETTTYGRTLRSEIRAIKAELNKRAK